jgi:hypothetical protein
VRTSNLAPSAVFGSANTCASSSCKFLCSMLSAHDHLPCLAAAHDITDYRWSESRSTQREHALTYWSMQMAVRPLCHCPELTRRFANTAIKVWFAVDHSASANNSNAGMIPTSWC